jgi:hypothetical protein
MNDKVKGIPREVRIKFYFLSPPCSSKESQGIRRMAPTSKVRLRQPVEAEKLKA